jgi:ABC-type molybdate transport system substrate-binding protein
MWIASKPTWRGGLIAWIAGAFAGSAQTANQLTVCHAGSLEMAFTEIEKEFSAQRPDVAVRDVSGGSVALAGRMAAGLQPCDVYASADYQVIDLLLKPAGLAEYTIVFARGRMVLAYLASDPKTQGVAASADFRPPASIPAATQDWYRVLLTAGVRISSSHPFLDPGGYRTHMIFRLAQAYHDVPNLANLLMERVTISAAASGDVAPGPALGKDFNFQFTYEHNALRSATSDPAYRYVTLPERIDLSTAAQNAYYAQASVTIPSVAPHAAPHPVSIPASRVAWGLTIPKGATNPLNAESFVTLVLGEAGQAALHTHGPAPIRPAIVTKSDYARLPKSIRSLVTTGQVLP